MQHNNCVSKFFEAGHFQISAQRWIQVVPAAVYLNL
jgi:hypothetical protein